MPRTPKVSDPSVAVAVKNAASSLPPAESEGTLYLIDLSGYVFRAYHAIAPLSNSKGEPTHAVLGTVNMLQKVVNERRPHMLAVAMDSKGPTFRAEVDARYKATRPPPPDDLKQQMARCEQIVRAYNIPCYQQNGLEADDLIASVVHRALEHGVRVVIVSSDKDLMQLVRDDSDAIVLWDSMRDRVYGPNEVQTKFGVRPSQVRDLLALTGDTSDNVPGVPGVGPKTAADLLNQFGSVDAIYSRLDEVVRPRLRDLLKTHESDVRISRELVSLRDDPAIAWDPDHLRYGGANLDELKRLFTELEFHRVLDQLPNTSAAKRAAAPKAAEIRERERICVLDAKELENYVREAEKTGVLAIDVELTEESPHRADVIGISLATTPGRGLYVPISHRYLGCPPLLNWSVLRDVLGPVLANPKIKKVSHDIKTVDSVLRQQRLEIKGPIFDTHLASYLLDPEAPNKLKELARHELSVLMTPYRDTVTKRGTLVPFDNLAVEIAKDYGGANAELALSLSERFEPRLHQEGLGSLMNDVEVPLCRVLAEMELHGVLVNTAYLEQVGKRVDAELRRLESEAKQVVGRDFAIRSRDQLEKIFFDDLKLPVLKRTPKGGRSTDAEVLEELAEQHALPRLILEYRELDKLKGTYIDALPKAVNPKSGRIHTSFGQAIAATGRLSSNDPNLQNIPIRTELGREIRAAFVAPPGKAIVSADYSQIELRVLAHLSQDPELVDAFRTNDDVHTRTASLIFNVSREHVSSDMRRSSKTINFGVIYGMGDSALGKQLGIPRAEAGKFIAAYFERYAKVKSFMQRTVEAARQGEAVRTLLGRRRFLANLHSANRGLRMEAERIAMNTPIQGTAADILKLAMVRLGSREVVPGARMILTVHDELVFEVPEELVELASQRIKLEMESAVKLDVPLVVDVGHGPNWRDAH